MYESCRVATALSGRNGIAAHLMLSKSFVYKQTIKCELINKQDKYISISGFTGYFHVVTDRKKLPPSDWRKILATWSNCMYCDIKVI